MERTRLYRQGRVPEALQKKRREPRQVLGQGRQAARLDQALYARQERLVRLSRRVDQMVRGRHAERLGQLHRPASEEARQADRHHLRARRPRARGEAHHLSRAAQAGVPPGQCAEGKRGQARRPGDDLSADDPGDGLRHARLRADRRHPLGRVRRLLAGTRWRDASRTANRSFSSRPTRACAAGARSRSRPTPMRR